MVYWRHVIVRKLIKYWKKRGYTRTKLNYCSYAAKFPQMYSRMRSLVQMCVHFPHADLELYGIKRTRCMFQYNTWVRNIKLGPFFLIFLSLSYSLSLWYMKNVSCYPYEFFCGKLCRISFEHKVSLYLCGEFYGLFENWYFIYIKLLLTLSKTVYLKYSDKV